VDANVLIFERIREELRLGKKMAAIDAGFSRAMVTIIDSNLTTLITALVLFQFGTGPVKGFAITLTIGLIANFYTGVLLTRIIFDYLYVQKRWPRISIGLRVQS
jgi:preprotein translocase subunit SecD